MPEVAGGRRAGTRRDWERNSRGKGGELTEAAMPGIKRGRGGGNS